MSKLLSDMQSLMVKQVPIMLGTVSVVNPSVIVVSSPQGARRFWVPSSSVYQIGDQVRFQGEVLLGKVASESSIPSFSV